MTYTINPAADNAPDEPFHGYRHFWSKSYGGAHLPAYEEGYALGQADLEADSTDTLTALLAVSSLKRDLDWNAKADGYSYATRSRGPTELGRYF
jgi:hypothetical protein